MKTILRILTILMIGALVAGGVYLIGQNTATVSDMGGASSIEQMPDMSTVDLSALPARPEGGDDHNVASLSRGLSEVGVSLAKLTGITLLVPFFQNLFTRLKNRQVAKLVL